MGWLGKVIGGSIGYALGGPLGAIAGLAFGHTLDIKSNVPPTDKAISLSKNEETQMVFFVAVFSMLAKIAKADGTVCDREHEMVERFIKKDLKLNEESRQIAMKIFETAIDSPDTFECFAEQFYTHFQSQPGIVEFIIDLLLQVSMSDGTYNPKEEELILKALHMFNCTTESYLKMKLKYMDKGKDYHAVLGCDRQDSDEFVKKQYKKLVSDYQPNEIASKGLPDEFKLFASEKFREIQEAYEKVKQERGMS